MVAVAVAVAVVVAVAVAVAVAVGDGDDDAAGIIIAVEEEEEEEEGGRVMASMNAAASWISRRGTAIRVSICGSEGSHYKRIYTKYVNSSYISPTYFFVPGLTLAEKSQICSNVDMSTDFSRHKKNTTDQQTDRQQIWFTGTLYYIMYMLIPKCAQLHYAKINDPKYAFSGIFTYGDPRTYANFSCAKCAQICPYANPHMRINTAQTLQK